MQPPTAFLGVVSIDTERLQAPEQGFEVISLPAAADCASVLSRAHRNTSRL